MDLYLGFDHPLGEGSKTMTRKKLEPKWWEGVRVFGERGHSTFVALLWSPLPYVPNHLVKSALHTGLVQGLLCGNQGKAAKSQF